MSRRLLWLSGVALVAVFAASLLTACTVSISGGIAGIVSTFALLGLLLGIGATQSGCSDDSVKTDVGACLSPLDIGACLRPDPDFGPCLSHPDVGPCLQPPPPDGNIDGCLSVDGSIFDVQACLSPLDLGPCLKVPAPDGNLGPCLSPPPPQPGAALVPAPAHRATEPAGPLDRQRAAAIDRLRDRLPADVIARLTAEPDDRSS